MSAPARFGSVIVVALRWLVLVLAMTSVSFGTAAHAAASDMPAYSAEHEHGEASEREALSKAGQATDEHTHAIAVLPTLSPGPVVRQAARRQPYRRYLRSVGRTPLERPPATVLTARTPAASAIGSTPFRTQTCL